MIEEFIEETQVQMTLKSCSASVLTVLEKKKKKKKKKSSPNY